MSSLHATPAAAPASRQRQRPATPQRPRLRVVPLPVRRPARTPFVLLVAGLLAAGLLGLLLLNTVLAQDAFVVHDLQKQSALLTDREQALQQDVAAEASPERLAARARALGLVPSENPVFLRLTDGRIVGVPAAAKAPPKPKPTPKPAGAASPASPTSSASSASSTPVATPTAGAAR